MTLYHLVLLGLAACGTLACARGMPVLPRCCAWIGWAAMALAMIGGIWGLIMGGAIMMASALAMVRATDPVWLTLYRTTGMACMLAVLAVLYAINGPDFCGPLALPLLDQTGIVPRVLDPGLHLQIRAVLIALAVFALGSLIALCMAVFARRTRLVLEILPSSAAVIGMAVGVS